MIPVTRPTAGARFAVGHSGVVLEVWGASSSRVPLTARIRRMVSSSVVLPTPGPPVMTATFERSTISTAARCDAASVLSVFFRPKGRPCRCRSLAMEATPWTAPEGARRCRARRDRGRVGTSRGGSRSCRLLPRLPRVDGLAQSEQCSRPLRTMLSPAAGGLRPAGRNSHHRRSLPARRKKSPPESVGRFPRHTELHGDGVGGAKPDAANVAGPPIRVLDQQPPGFSPHKLRLPSSSKMSAIGANPPPSARL
jgi:hypothetical protein